jgi:hypothetical protein
MEGSIVNVIVMEFIHFESLSIISNKFIFNLFLVKF